MRLSSGTGNFGEVYDTVDDILHSSPEPDSQILYTGTTAEMVDSKVEAADGVLSEEEEKLWFTPRAHGHPFSAIHYANESLWERPNADETPAIVEWEVPNAWIEEDVSCEVPDDKYLVSCGEAEYWAREIPVESLNGYLRPSEGPRLRGDWEMDPEGWEFLSYDD